MQKWAKISVNGALGAISFVTAPFHAAIAQSETSTESKGGFGGPASTRGQLEEGAAVTEPAFRFPGVDGFLQPWFDMKARVKERYGLAFGVHYTGTYQAASESLPGGEDDAGGGIVRFLGDWALVNPGGANEGALDFSFDHRHRYWTEIAPADLGFAVGYLGIPATLFSDARWVLVDLNWQQLLNDGNTGFVIGRYDPNDYFDVLGYSNPWATFQNLAILFNTSIALPDASLGIGGGHWFNDQVYALATINDANGVVTEVEWFEGGAEFYTSAELGWSPTRAQRYTHNIHVMGWHSDRRDDAGVPESWGFVVSANWTLDNGLMTFGRVGWSDGDAPLANTALTLGLLFDIPASSNQAGMAVDWSDPPDDGLKEQFVGEIFYRFQLAQNLAITPNIQLVIDPAANPLEDQIWIGGLRARITM